MDQQGSPCCHNFQTANQSSHRQVILIGPLDAEKIAEGGFLYVSTIALNLDKLNNRKNTLCKVCERCIQVWKIQNMVCTQKISTFIRNTFAQQIVCYTLVHISINFLKSSCLSVSLSLEVEAGLKKDMKRWAWVRRSLGSSVLTGGCSWTEGRQAAEERLRAVGPLRAMFSLEVKTGISPIQQPVWVLQHKCTLNEQVHFFLW